MNQNESRTFWISILCAIFAVLILYSYTNEQKSQLAAQYAEEVLVVVAKSDINEMETIDASMLEISKKPTTFAEPGSIANPDEIIGQVALVPIKAKEQVLESKVMKPGPVTGLSMQVAPGKRALTIPIDEMRGVAKLIKPGDRVDIITAIDVGRGANSRREVKTLLQNVTVLATGLKIVNELPRLFETVGKEDFIKNIRSDTTFDNLTVEVSPDESQKLVYLLSTSPGSIFFSLRHPSDNKTNSLAQTSVDSLLNRTSTSTIRKQIRTPASLPRSSFTPSSKPKRTKKKPTRKSRFREIK